MLLAHCCVTKVLWGWMYTRLQALGWTPSTVGDAGPQHQLAGDSFREVSRDHTHKQHRHRRRRTSKSRLNSAQVRARLRSSESGSIG